MPRQARVAPGGLIYHVLNRGAGRQDLFQAPDDFAAFLRVMSDVLQDDPIRVLGFCLMSNHWHLVLWPERDGQLARFMQRLTITHVRRWTEHRQRVGWGSVYQGRYKSFAVQDDAHLSTVLRYVERNPLRARLVRRAEAWRWSSLGQLVVPGDPQPPAIPIADWPVARRRDWVAWVNRPQMPKDEAAVLRSLTHDRPCGSETWTAKIERRLGLGPLRPRGRPKGWRKPAK
ncbi:MAG: transposase [Planctomycetota bacterium]|nr:transposase [Planctomycetota bacterium]